MSALNTDQKIFVNGEEVNKDQPVKISKIEVIENILTPTKPETDKLKLQLESLEKPAEAQKSEVLMKSQTKESQETQEGLNTPVKVNTDLSIDQNIESTIVTPDYIQQSM